VIVNKNRHGELNRTFW